MISGKEKSTNLTKASSSSTSTVISSSKSWSRVNDPRIFRVSRAFGGKDRHSKVFTVKGLRDRRIRLSIPTAVQLYDLQERLGLSQPSKVIDWLLNETKNDIDDLPPLQMPPAGSLGHHQMLSSSGIFRPFPPDKQAAALLAFGTAAAGSCINWNHYDKLIPRSNFAWGSTTPSSKDVPGELIVGKDGNSARIIEEGKHGTHQGEYAPANFLTGSIPSYGTAVPVPYMSSSSFLKFETPNLRLSRNDETSPSTRQNEDFTNLNLVQLPSPLPPGSQQVLLYQPGMTVHPYFPSHISAMNQGFQGNSQPAPSNPCFHSPLTRPFSLGSNLLIQQPQGNAISTERNKESRT